MRETIDRITTGVIGTVSPVAGTIISLQNIETGLRILSLVLGIAVSVAALIRLNRKGQRD